MEAFFSFIMEVFGVGFYALCRQFGVSDAKAMLFTLVTFLAVIAGVFYFYIGMA